jgi:hypothetical protein
MEVFSIPLRRGSSTRVRTRADEKRDRSEEGKIKDVVPKAWSSAAPGSHQRNPGYNGVRRCNFLLQPLL